MQDKESLVPRDWFQKGNADIKTVEILLAHDGDMEIAAMHIQQAIEKYFKGYLLSQGWELKRTHDLVELLDYVIEYDSKFENVGKNNLYYYNYNIKLKREVLKARRDG